MCLEPFQKTKNKTQSQSAVFVASTSIKIIITSIPTINFGKLVNVLNISQMWWRCRWLSLQFNQYLRQSTRNEIFPTFTSPMRVDFKFPTFTSPMKAFVVCTYYVLYRIFFLKSLSCFIYLLQGKILRSKYLDREIFLFPFFVFLLLSFRYNFFCCNFYHAFSGHIFCSNVWIELMQEWFHRVHAFLFFVKFAYQYFLLHFQIKK